MARFPIGSRPRSGLGLTVRRFPGGVLSARVGCGCSRGLGSVLKLLGGLFMVFGLNFGWSENFVKMIGVDWLYCRFYGKVDYYVFCIR